MTNPLRFAVTGSLVVLASALAGCAAPQGRLASASAPAAKKEAGLASRAVAALAANNLVEAIALTERAVEQTPDSAALRTLLGNAYFAAGRFASAESAFKDSLALDTNQPQVLLKLALVEIAQGKSAQAMAFLEAGREMLPAADYGLALALAGRPHDAVPILEASARSPRADSQVRQNLALAYALVGDWTQARTVAAQDVPAGQLDARLQQWMQFAKPARSSDQVAALTGIAPAAADSGQPVRLALVRGDTRMASAGVPLSTPTPAPAPHAATVMTAIAAPAPAAPQLALAPPPPPPARSYDIPQPPVADVAPPPPPPARAIAMAAAMAPDAPAAFAALNRSPSPAKLRRASAPARAAVRPASLRRTGTSTAVVQLGAYGSTHRVLTAWNDAARRFGMLKDYTPMSARFASRDGVVYRLSVKGFASTGEASALCASLRRSGGSCFVRNVAGDAPVRFASR